MKVAAQKFLSHARGFVDVATANTQRTIHHRRIVKDESFLRGRRAVGIQHFHLGFEQPRSQFAGIGDRRGAANELGLALVETRNASQAAENVAEVASENAAISMQFVENDVAKIFEQPCPARVMRQDAGVQHIRIRQHDVAFLANGFARVGGRVAIVSENAKAVV